MSLRETPAPTAASAKPSTAEYRVRQLNLAAYFLLVGHELVRLEPMRTATGQFCEFIFHYEPGIAMDRLAYYEHQAQVDPRLYAETLLGLKRRAIETTEESRVNAKTTQ